MSLFLAYLDCCGLSGLKNTIIIKSIAQAPAYISRCATLIFNAVGSSATLGTTISLAYAAVDIDATLDRHLEVSD